MVWVQVDERCDGERLACHDDATRSMSSGEKLGNEVKETYISSSGFRWEWGST